MGVTENGVGGEGEAEKATVGSNGYSYHRNLVQELLMKNSLTAIERGTVDAAGLGGMCHCSKWNQFSR
jgi:hypothetical protein